MIASALTALLLSCHPAPDGLLFPGPGPTRSSDRAGQDDDRKAEYARRKKAAAGDVDALWELFLWCDAYGMTKESRSCLRAIVKADPSHREARTGLGHIFYDGQWFTTEKKLEKYKKEEQERIAKEQGLVLYKGEWVPKDDLPFLERGMVRDDNGLWVTAEEFKRISEGWQRQDLQWIAPDEVENLSKGLWKCGDEWLAIEEANGFHSELDQWWAIPSDHFLLFTTNARDIAKQAGDVMDFAYRDMLRLFGTAPEGRLPVVLLKDASQYNRFASGGVREGEPTELRVLSSVHHAFFADSWFDEESKTLLGAGVAYWDSSTEAGNRFGPLATRHAAALSFVEAIDPSPKTSAKAAKSGGLEESDLDAFWGEKKIPEWLRYGAAAYAERYFIDGLVRADGNPYWAREWSVQNIQARGGLRPVSQLFDTELTVNDSEGSEKLINERGLLVAFIMDGECGAVSRAHAALKEAFAAGKNPSRAIDKLRKEIEKHESELKQFAGI